MRTSEQRAGSGAGPVPSREVVPASALEDERADHQLEMEPSTPSIAVARELQHFAGEVRAPHQVLRIEHQRRVLSNHSWFKLGVIDEDDHDIGGC